MKDSIKPKLIETGKRDKRGFMIYEPYELIEGCGFINGVPFSGYRMCPPAGFDGSDKWLGLDPCSGYSVNPKTGFVEKDGVEYNE